MDNAMQNNAKEREQLLLSLLAPHGASIDERYARIKWAKKIIQEQMKKLHDDYMRAELLDLPHWGE